jgi:hypothetical protein
MAISNQHTDPQAALERYVGPVTMLDDHQEVEMVEIQVPMEQEMPLAAEKVPDDIFADPPDDDPEDLIDIKDLTNPAGYEPDEHIIYNHNVPIDTAEGMRKLAETLMIIGATNARKAAMRALNVAPWRPVAREIEASFSAEISKNSGCNSADMLK